MEPAVNILNPGKKLTGGAASMSKLIEIQKLQKKGSFADIGKASRRFNKLKRKLISSGLYSTATSAVTSLDGFYDAYNFEDSCGCGQSLESMPTFDLLEYSEAHRQKHGIPTSAWQ